MDEFADLISLGRQGFHCSQILILKGLENMGKNNPELVRAMDALGGGVGFSGELCGALTGGACLLGLYAGKSEADQPEDPQLDFMVQDLVRWFQAEYGQQFGGIRCVELLEGNNQNKVTRCPVMITGVYRKVVELLIEHGYDLSGEEG